MKRNIIAFTLFALTSFAGAQTDYTSRITNPSFETGDLTGWTSKNMGTMDNAFFDIKQGTWYVEKWTGRGSSVGDARLSQKLTGMPAGRYRPRSRCRHSNLHLSDTQQQRHAAKSHHRPALHPQLHVGSDIIEEGFCWSEQPDPKVTDHRTTEYINQAGKIYWLRDLKPATIYYMRAYAMTKDYAVGYGDVIKVVTVPKGTVSHHPSRCSPRLLHH